MSEEPTLSSILTGDAASAVPPTPQEATTAALQLDMLSSGRDVPAARFRFRTDDAHEWVARMVYERLGRRLSGCPVWMRVFDNDIGLLAVLHCQADYEMELILLGNPGVLNRVTIRLLVFWAFHRVAGEGLQRVVLRIPDSCDHLKDYARRAGFRHEGTARGFFGDRDASLWALTRSDADRGACRLIRRFGERARAAPVEPRPSGQRIH